MSNYHLKDKNLSLKAIGLLSKILSLPEDWDYSLEGLVAISKESIYAIRSTVDELKRFKYIKIEQSRDKKGFYEYIYHIYEKPYDLVLKNEIHPDINNRHMDNPYMENRDIENQRQYNTNKLNTKEININNNLDKLDKSNFPSIFNQLCPLTKNLVKKQYIDEDDSSIFNYNDFFNDLLDQGFSYRGLLDDSNYVISKVKERNFIDENGYEIKNKFGYFKESITNRINIVHYSNQDEDEFNWLDDDIDLWKEVV